MRSRILVATAVVVVLAGSIGVGGVAAASGRTAAQAQYTPVAPVPKPTKPSSGVKGQTAGKGGVKGQTAGKGSSTASAPPKTSGLPFTGTSLVVPFALSLALIVLGAGIRRKFRARRQP